MNRAQRKQLEKAQIKFSENCALCRRFYDPYEHTYDGIKGEKYMVVCSKCGERSLDIVLGIGVARADPEMAYKDPRDDPRLAEAFHSHPYALRIKSQNYH